MGGRRQKKLSKAQKSSTFGCFYGQHWVRGEKKKPHKNCTKRPGKEGKSDCKLLFFCLFFLKFATLIYKAKN